MSSELKHFMVDIETLGNNSNSPIVTIAIQEFDPSEGLCSPGTSRYIFVKPNPDAEMDYSTIEWWLGQEETPRRHVIEAIKAGQTETAALHELSRFIRDICPNIRNVRLWGNGATFDNVILDNAYRRNNISPPWNYSGHRCYRTMVNLLSEKIKLTRTGNHHCATDDVAYQLDVLREVMKKKKLKNLY